MRSIQAYKISLEQKNDSKKHLSTSRRRALCLFFLQNSVAVQTLAPPKAAARSVGYLAISLCEKNCKDLIRACTKCSGWQERVMI